MKWGAWGSKFTTVQYREIIDHCISLGINTFDHADIDGDYTTEQDFGKALAGNSSIRTGLKLITKCGINLVSDNRPENKIKSYNTSFQHIITSAEKSLVNLHTDYIDVLLIHRPDPLLDADEVAEAFTRLKNAGKVLQFGVSNFNACQLNLLNSRFPLVANQIEVSIVNLTAFLNGTLDQCQEKKLVPMAWSPLGGGNLFNPESGNETHLRIAAMATLMAEKYNTTPDIILLSWLIKHPSGIIPVLGTSRMDRISAATEALNIALTREDWFYLWRASTGQEVD
jgi:predicted oxidoreductase